MKRWTRVSKVLVSLMVSLLLTMSVCHAAESTYVGAKADTSKRIDLKMYFVGGKSADHAKVMAEINKKLLAKLNTTLDLSYISWADMNTKYQLLFASGENFDAIFTADWAHYASQAYKNGFMEITDSLLSKYAPNIKKNTPKEVWNQVKINKKIYMIPQLQEEYAQKQFILRGDIREKYKIPAKFSTFKDLEPYLSAVKKESGMVGIIQIPTSYGLKQEILLQQNEWGKAGNNTNFGFAYYKIGNTNTATLYNLLDSPEYLEHLKLMRRWNKLGFFQRSLLNNKIDGRAALLNGQCGLMFQNIGSANNYAAELRRTKPDWKLEVYDTTMGKKVLPYPATGGGLGIRATTKNADRVLMVTDYMRYDKEMNLLAQRGIQGEHWNIAPGQNDINVTVSGPSAGKFPDSFGWGPWRNTMYQSMPAKQDAIPGYLEYVASAKKRTVVHPLLSFNYNGEKYKNELAAIKSISDIYLPALEFGFVEPTAKLAEFKQKLDAAGFQKVFADMQFQANVHRATTR